MADDVLSNSGAEDSGTPVGTTFGYEPDAIPETVKSLVEKKGFKSVEDIASSYTELEKKLGSGEYEIPGEDDLEGRNKLYDRLGRPESPDNYEVRVSEGSPEMDANLVDTFKIKAHSLGLTNAQFNELIQFQLDAVGESSASMAEEHNASIAKAEQALKSEWKEEYEKEVALAQKAVDTLGVADVLESKGLLSDPDMIKLFNNIGKAMGDAVIKKNNDIPAVTPERELSQIEASDAFVQKMHPDHRKVMQRWRHLHGIGG